MSTPAGGQNAAQSDQAITNFSQCHIGIVEQLMALAELPALIAPANRARMIALQTLALFNEVIAEHHAQEESELFPVVLENAARGDEKEQAKAIVTRLAAEHRRIEAAWSHIKPGLEALAKGRDGDLDMPSVEQLVNDYRAHAAYEEEAFLPLAQAILGRDSKEMAALGLSLHMRHIRHTHPIVGLI